MAVGALVSMIGYTAGNALGSPRFIGTGRRRVFICAPCSLPALSYAGRGNHPDHRYNLLRSAGAQLSAAGDTEQPCRHLPVSLNLRCCYSIAAHAARLDRGFKIPFGSAIAAAGCIVSVWLMKQVAVAELICACGVLAVGLVVKKVLHGRAVTSPHP